MYDPLLVRYLAEELDRALRGRACAAAPLFSPDGSVTLPLEGERALRLDLHPRRGWVRLIPYSSAGVSLDARCTGVTAPADERRLVIGISPSDRFGRTDRELVIELHTNQWNALLLSADDRRIVAVLRARDAGTRTLRPGSSYEPPPGSPRLGVEEVDEEDAWSRWREVVGGAHPGDRRSAVLRGFAYTGSANVDAVLGAAGEENAAGSPEVVERGAAGTSEVGAGQAAPDRDLRDAFERWWSLILLRTPMPCLLRTDRGLLPYPVPLEGVDREKTGSLLEGMDRAASGPEGTPGAAPVEDAALLEAATRRAEGLERRVRRLEEELAAAGDAERLRGLGDLILSRLHEVPRGADRVELQGWGGEKVEIPLDPALSPADNAKKLYEEARKRARAEERIPAMLEAARPEAERWRAAVAAAEADRLPDWARAALLDGSGGNVGAAEGESESRPYRVFRTSGGLEVRVGRSAKANDRLTFGHSSPNDVWLHARSVPGSHVVLRWPSVDEAPPARDLEEAAVLAARYSRARTSAVVAVDWTRRKHVRKPRGAPPGSVVIQRAKTVFVEPDEAVEERLRVD